MNEAIALEIGHCKMRELGIKEYVLRFRHFTLEQTQTKIIKNPGTVYILVGGDITHRVVSKSGTFELAAITNREQQYVHTGDLTLTNLIQNDLGHFKFLQLIPV